MFAAHSIRDEEWIPTFLLTEPVLSTMSYALPSDFPAYDAALFWRRQQLLLLPSPKVQPRDDAGFHAIHAYSPTSDTPRSRRGLSALALVTVAAHLAGAAYLVQERVLAPQTPPSKLVLELTRPKPPEPKPEPVFEPPKPLPQVARKPLARPQTPPPIPVPVQEPPETLAPETPVAHVEPAPPAPVENVKETEALGYAGYLDNPSPKYPATAQRMGWQGTVLLKVRVLADGRPASIEVAQSSGRKVLDEAALSTVRQWLFTPARRGDVAVEGWATVPIDFKLS